MVGETRLSPKGTVDYPSDIKDAILVTHRYCLDGAGCAVMFLGAGGKEENIRYITAGSVERFIKDDLAGLEGKFIIFADVGFSPNAEKYIKIMEQRGNFVMMDHHKTSLYLQGKKWADVRQDLCGCRMLREYLTMDLSVDEGFGRDLYFKELTNAIDDNDRWLKKDQRSWKLVMLMQFYGQEEFVRKFRRRMFNELITPTEEDLLTHILRQDKEAAEDAMKNVVVCKVSLPSGKTVNVGYVCSQGGTNSQMLHDLLNRRPDLDVTCQINLYSGTVSLRSRHDGVDVTELAKPLGGGGHKSAAGHRLADDLLSQVAQSIHSGIVLED